MAPKINFSNQMISFIIEAYKQLKSNGLNLKKNLPILFYSEFGLNVSYTKLSSFATVNCAILAETVCKVKELSIKLIFFLSICYKIILI